MAGKKPPNDGNHQSNRGYDHVQKKFLDWVNQLPDNDGLQFTLATLNDDRPVYLVPEFDGNEEAAEWFSVHKDLILEEQFESICTEEAWWPKDRSEKDFDEYLSADYSSMVWDLVEDEPIEHEAM